jgi:hypothetical protein
MKKKLAVSALFVVGIVLFPSDASAQKSPRAVYISGGEERGREFEKQVISALTTMIAAATRYTLADEMTAELTVSMLCVDMADVTKRAVGAVCSYTVTYYPKELEGLCTVLSGPAIATGGEPSQIGEAMFQEFVKVSAEKALASGLSLMLKSIARYEASRAIRKP